MSQDQPKKNSLRQLSLNNHKKTLNQITLHSENFNSLKKIALIKERKYTSTKNLPISNTYSVIPLQDQIKNNCLSKLKKRINKRISEKYSHLDVENTEEKYFFQKRGLKTLQFDAGQLKKYSSCNKLTSFPSIAEIHASNDQSFALNQNAHLQPQIKSSNSIKLEPVQYLKKPRLERIPLKKLLQHTLSKTINPRKVQSQNSIQIENEQKNPGIAKKKSKLSKDIFDRIDSKTKILVKNPFHKMSKKWPQTLEKFQMQNLPMFEEQFRLSNIFQDTQDQSEISVSGKNEIQDFIQMLNQ